MFVYLVSGAPAPVIQPRFLLLFQIWSVCIFQFFIVDAKYEIRTCRFCGKRKHGLSILTDRKLCDAQENRFRAVSTPNRSIRRFWLWCKTKPANFHICLQPSVSKGCSRQMKTRQVEQNTSPLPVLVPFIVSYSNFLLQNQSHFLYLLSLTLHDNIGWNIPTWWHVCLQANGLQFQSPFELTCSCIVSCTSNCFWQNSCTHSSKCLQTYVECFAIAWTTK